MEPSLSDLVARELAEPVDGRVTAISAVLAALYPTAARAVLFYGSCLRERQLEGLMLDFYLIVSDYEAAYAKRWMRAANRLLPPNVFPFTHDGLTAKYAVLSEADFARECGLTARSVSVWARFAQPSRLVWAADDLARAHAAACVAQAAPTLFHFTVPMIEAPLACTPNDIWRTGFALTYGAELRAECKQPGRIVEADPERYARFGSAALAQIASRTGSGSRGEVPAVLSPMDARRQWRGMRAKGKALTLLRLLKASATFAGGIDYLAWKINRHAGTRIEVKRWQRRWPLLAGLILLPRLLRRGAVR